MPLQHHENGPCAHSINKIKSGGLLQLKKLLVIYLYHSVFG